MDKLRQLLESRGWQGDDDRLLQVATKYGFNPDTITEKEAQAIADEEFPQSGLTVANPANKPATRRGGGRKKKVTDIDPTEAIIKASKGVESELTAYEQSLLANKPAYVEQRSDRIVNEILSTSAEVTHAVAQKLNAAEVDPDSFRTTGAATGNVLFPLEQSDEAA